MKLTRYSIETSDLRVLSGVEAGGWNRLSLRLGEFKEVAVRRCGQDLKGPILLFADFKNDLHTCTVVISRACDVEV